MKKLLLILTLFISVTAFSQSTYTASRTSLWTKYSWEQEWKQSGETNEVSIEVTLSNNALFIDAKQPLNIRIVAGSGEEFTSKTKDGEPFKGITYRGYNMDNGKRVNVDLVNYLSTGWMVIGITYNDNNPALNLRYYILKN